MKFDFLKNITVHRFALLISCFLAIFIALFYLLLDWLFNQSPAAIKLPIIILLTFSFCYCILLYTINYLVLRRIKLIYKIISETKFDEFTQQQESNDVLENLNKVEKDVEIWINRKNLEIDHMNELERYRKEYVGNVSHELKTPVFNIQGYLQSLLSGGLEDAKVNKIFVTKALKNAIRLQNIIDDLNIVYKLESGDQILEMQRFNIRTMIEEVFEENLELAIAKNIKLNFKPGADNEYIVHADPEHIRIVLNNLINNSIKYGKVNGYTKVSLYDLENSILVEVTDNGIGIAEEHLKHVFDRFYRVDKSRSSEQGGSGIGLSIVKHIIENHGQKIHVRSKEGYGTTFGFTLEKSG